MAQDKDALIKELAADLVRVYVAPQWREMVDQTVSDHDVRRAEELVGAGWTKRMQA